MLEALNVTTVPELWQRRASIFKEAQADLSQVRDIDSAGVAFLVRWAKARPEGTLTLCSVPDNALRLIKTFKLEPLFVIKGHSD